MAQDSSTPKKVVGPSDPSAFYIQFTPTKHSKPYDAVSPAVGPSLANRSVFITGSARGIGACTALSIARSGASLIGLADIREAPASQREELVAAAKEYGHPEPKFVSLALDVTDADSVKKAVGQFLEVSGGKLDVLVHVAGVFAPYVPLLDADPKREWAAFEVNVKGTMNVVRELLQPLMDGEGLKTMLVVNSVGATLPAKGGGAYRSSKLAQLRWLECLMEDYGDTGLVAIAIHPGAILTELGKELPEQMHKVLTDDPQLAGDTMAFLAKERRPWLAGRYVSCTWDMPEFLAKEEEVVKGDKLKMRLVQ